MTQTPNTFTGRLETWKQEAGDHKKRHSSQAQKLETTHYRFGIIVVTLSSIAGSSVFALLEKETNVLLKVALGLISVAAAVLAGLQTFLNFANRAEKHRVAAGIYAEIQSDIEVRLATPRVANYDLEKALKEVQGKMVEAAQQSPTVSLPERTTKGPEPTQ